MYGSNYVFSKTFFTAWLVFAIIWLWCTMLVAGFYPIIDGREQLIFIWRAWRKKPQIAKTSSSSDGEGNSTPPLKVG